MGTGDKVSAGLDKLKGKAEEVVGKVTGDDKLVAEGKADQVKGDVKQSAEKAKDAVKDVLDN
jgi:uncharacterized protein YjbJ (UPF0337 family)